MSKRIRNLISFLLSFFILFQFSIVNVEAKGLSLTAASAICIDYDTGEVLYEKNPDAWLVPASLTKIMTTYIIYQELEAGNLTKDTLIKVSPNAARISRDRSYPMSVPLQNQASYSVDQFIKLIMIPSASASCVAVGEHISGSEQAFVARMNKTAKDLGLEAKFTNSHGAKPHYTTSRSMAKLVRTFIDEYPDILNYTSLPSISFGGRNYKILNKLLNTRKYEGCDGFKTGTISEAGYCLASTAKRDGRRIIAIVLKSTSESNRYTDSTKVLDRGFEELRARDKSRQNAQVTFSNLPEELRLNTDYRATINFSNLNTSFRTDARFLLDGQVIDAMKDVMISPNIDYNFNFIKSSPTNKDKVVLEYELILPTGKTRVFKEEIKVSSESPALYRDLKNKDLEDKLKVLSQENLLNGVGNGYFGVNNPTSRADFLTSLGRLVEYFDLETIENKPNNYKDVKDTAYYNKYVTWADENNFIQGHGGKFMPKSKISIEEVGVILNKFFQVYDLKLKADMETENIDLNNLSPWAKPYMDSISNNSIFYDNKVIKPKDKLTRSKLGGILYELYDLAKPSSSEDLDQPIIENKLAG